MSRLRIPTWLRRGAGLVIVLLLLEYVVLPQLAGARDALHVLSGVRPLPLVLGVALEVASLAAYSMLTRGVLPAAGRPSLWTLARIDLTTLGVSHVVPGGAATSSTLRYRLLTEAGVGPSDTIAGEAIEGAGSAVVLNVLLWIALVISLRAHGGNVIYTSAAVLGTVLIAVVLAVVVLVTRDGTTTVRRLRALARRLPAVSPDSVERLVRTLAARLRALAVDRRQLARTTLWAVANWALDAAALWVFLAAYGHRTDVDGLAVAYGLAHVLAAVPLTPGGLGVVEGILVPTLVGFGSPRSIAVLGVVTWRLVNFWLPIPVSALTYLSLRTGPLRHHRLSPAHSSTPQIRAVEAAPPTGTAQRNSFDPGRRTDTAGAGAAAAEDL